MKVVIAYYSQHHGNTKKLLDAIQEMGDVKLINVVECQEADLSGYDLIGLASGTYFGKFSKQVMEFARNNLPRGGSWPGWNGIIRRLESEVGKATDGEPLAANIVQRFREVIVQNFHSVGLELLRVCFPVQIFMQHERW